MRLFSLSKFCLILIFVVSPSSRLFANDSLATPANLGPRRSDAIDPQALAALSDACQAADTNVLKIYQHGELVFERSFKPSPRIFSIQSVTKSVVAMAFGMVFQQTTLANIDTPLSQIIPEWGTEGFRAQVTIRMLLNHTSGIIDGDDMWSHPSTVDYAILRGPSVQPGTQFIYSNAAVSLLAPVFQKLSGGVAIDRYTYEKIFLPLGITDSRWSTDADSNVATSGGLEMSVDDMLKLGQLMLKGGNYNGRQIIPADWVVDMVSPSQGFYHYGLLWWLYNPNENGQSFKIYSGVGYGGQFITVYPEKGIVAVRVREIDTSLSLEDLTRVSMMESFPTLVGNL